MVDSYNMSRADVGPVRQPPPDRHDGELYGRPVPNVFTAEWDEGYQDGLEGRHPSAVGPKLQQINYMDGWETGDFERREIDSAGSSNT